MRRWAFVVALFGGFLLLGQSAAQPPEAAAPAPEWARSVEVIDAGTPIYDAPSRAASRRGTLREGTRLPAQGRFFGDGCARGTWYRVGEGRFVCEDHVAPSPAEPHGEPWPTVPEGRLLPLRYAFVRTDGALVYTRPGDYFLDQYYESVGDGFGLVITGRVDERGVRFYRTRRGLFIPGASVGFARGSDFAGVAIGEGAPLDIAWVRRRSADVRASPSGPRLRQASRREVLHVAAVRGAWAELTSGGFIRLSDIRRARKSPPPEELGEGERWIDVDVDEQVLVAYEGTRPVYATLVSTGRRGAHTATPLGTFRVWAKLAFSDMDNLERTDVRENYAIQSVPWVQYFEGANGLHAAFWHDDFGERRSHGCVNLAPRDARYLFAFTLPVLPDGWEARLPAEDEDATWIRVR